MIQRDLGNESYEALCVNSIGDDPPGKGRVRGRPHLFRSGPRSLHELGGSLGSGRHLAQFGRGVSGSGPARSGARLLPSGTRAVARSGRRPRPSRRNRSVSETILGHRGRYTAALEAQGEALEAIRNAEEHGYWLIAVTAGYSGSLAAVGRYEEARQTLADVSGSAEQLGNPALLARILIVEGRLLLLRG